MISKIVSNQNNIIKRIYKKTRDQNNNNIVIESEKLLFELLSSKITVNYILCTQTWLDKHSRSLFEKINVIVTTPAIIQKIAFTNTCQDVVSIVSFDIPKFKLQKYRKYLILENIQDPRNIASIIRTAVAFNFKEIFLTTNCVNLFNNKVIRSSVNTLFNIKVNYISDIIKTINDLKKLNYDLYATAIDKKAIKLRSIKPQSDSIAIVLGNEGHGVSNEVNSIITQKLYIEIQNTNSLNVAIAAAIIMYQLSGK